MGLQYALMRSGPLTMAPSPSRCVRIAPHRTMPTPNVEFHIQPLSLDKFGDPMHPFGAITVSVCNLRPTAAVYARIRNRDPAPTLRIKLNYLSTEEDREVAVEGISLARRIMAAKAWKIRPRNTGPARAAAEEDLRNAAGDLGTTIFHPVGTSKMGGDPLAVMDDRLR